MAMTETTETPHSQEHDDDPGREISLDPKRAALGRAMAWSGLTVFLILMGVVVFTESYRIPAAFLAFVFFWIWKAGKTILRGDLNRL